MNSQGSHRDPIGFRHALRGMALAWRRDRNLRIETLIGFLALALAWALDVSLVPVLVCVVLVLSLELVNSALERIVDLASPNEHPLARDAKDLAAGAVLMASMGSLVVGLIYLGPPLWGLLQKGL